MTIPLNRFVAFGKPYINLAAGALAALLVAKLNVLGIPGLGDHQNELATGLAAAGVWALTQGAAQLGDLKWLKGHHIQIAADAAVTAAAVRDAPPETVLPGAITDPETDAADANVSDAEELAAGPPPETSTVPDEPAA